MSYGQAMRIGNYQRPVDLIEIANRGKAAPQEARPSDVSFKDMFSRELASNRKLTFSRHAQERLFSRNIT